MPLKWQQPLKYLAAWDKILKGRETDFSAIIKREVSVPPSLLKTLHPYHKCYWFTTATHLACNKIHVKCIITFKIWCFLYHTQKTLHKYKSSWNFTVNFIKYKKAKSITQSRLAPRHTIPANKLLYQSHATWPRWDAGPVPNIKITSSGDKGVLRELIWKIIPKYLYTFPVSKSWGVL